MKKLTLYLVFVLLPIIFLFGCNGGKKKNKDESTPSQETETSNQTQNDTIRNCGAMMVLEEHMAKDAELKSKMEAIEKHCQAFIASRKIENIKVADTLTIPTLVHVIYNTENQNISDGQIRSQIDVLNQDFNKTNEDISKIPKDFEKLAANINIRFSLDSIIRISSSRNEWGTNDQMKFTTNGGSDVVNPSNCLNIWVCNIGGGILGYAQFPGDNPLTDGIVISPQFFGTQGFVSPPFDKGRTTTHEVGHWLNLRHIWGDGNCALDDFVDDTPLSDGPNFGCPQYPIKRCDSNDMTMNYMDYVDDACMYMFSNGQKDRMRAAFAAGGPRESFAK